MKATNTTATDSERLEREREFHNDRYADDALRQNRVGRPYESTETSCAKSNERILRHPVGPRVFVAPMGHNLLINLFRRMTPKIRTTDEHPLLMTDLQFIGSHFGTCRTEYFGLASLASSVARPLRRDLLLRHFREAVDRALFTLPLLRRQAWLVLLELGNNRYE
jgi:hypothetical protein